MLQIILLIIGVVGLVKRKIQVSSQREISGTPVIALSVFYLLIATGIFNLVLKQSSLSKDYYSLVLIGAVALVTLLTVIFAKGNPIPPKI